MPIWGKDSPSPRQRDELNEVQTKVELDFADLCKSAFKQGSRTPVICK